MKRFVFVILFSLIFGICSTVAIAWLATLLPTDELLLLVDKSDSWELFSNQRQGVWVGMAIFVSYKSTPTVHISDETIPKWSRLKKLPEYRGGDPKRVMCDYAYGWPFLSMWMSYDSLRDWQTGKSISQELSGTISSYKLPANIIIWGFAGDVVFFALLFSMCLIVMKSARRRWRIRKGNCPICCYNLRNDFSSGCPECGWGREAEA